MALAKARELIVVSGYYGFDNLGDEAILEQLTGELRKLVSPEKIVVLSNNPQKTALKFGVKAQSRWRLSTLTALLPQTKLFISGGGGLFQDKSSFKSPFYYGGQIALARFYGARVMIYAQGLGPLKSPLSQIATRAALALADEITLRDQASLTLVKNWQIKAALTADPVWQLAASPLPPSLAEQIKRLREQEGELLIGLSLRPSANFDDALLTQLVRSLQEALPAGARLVFLPLQKEQDSKLIAKFEKAWLEAGQRGINLDLADMQKPSQWLTLVSHFDLIVGMRLHALIMSLACGVPVVGLAYDAKVSQVLALCQQPILNLQKEEEQNPKWTDIFKQSLDERQLLALKAKASADSLRNLACQNFEHLARILAMQSDR